MLNKQIENWTNNNLQRGARNYVSLQKAESPQIRLIKQTKQINNSMWAHDQPLKIQLDFEVIFLLFLLFLQKSFTC